MRKNSSYEFKIEAVRLPFLPIYTVRTGYQYSLHPMSAPGNDKLETSILVRQSIGTDMFPTVRLQLLLMPASPTMFEFEASNSCQ